ncbi:MAG TPA: hypothetical protein VGQ59_07220 [Cyclobacteriaceae bacterium]|jgi:hypothetical protein|nr:hypothetical protein [Cyclobacteriaceae bacterium]
MARILLAAILLSVLSQCGNKTNSKSINRNLSIDSSAGLYRDSSQASFKILEKKEGAGFRYESIVVDYKIEYLSLQKELRHYLAKYQTTTETWTGAMSQHRRIKVELRPLDQLEKIELQIDENCDEIKFLDDYYMTVIRGCCGGEDRIGLFDYKNKLIVAGSNKIVYGTIPRSPLCFYIGYTPNYPDSTSMGVLTFSYGSNDSFDIEIVGDSSLVKYCTDFTPEMTINSKSSKDKYDEQSGTYDLWSLSEIKSKNEINNITIRILPNCYVPGKILPVIEIPIINGKPFGKDDRNQEVSL